MTTELEILLRNEVLGLTRECIKLGYKPTLLIRAINERDCSVFDLISQMLLTPDPQAGLTTLHDLGRLDLSLEVLVLSEPWCNHFPEDVLNAARSRLNDCGYNF